MCGAPCQAFSAFRDTRRLRGFAGHPTADLSTSGDDGSFIALLRTRRPACFVFENIINFVRPDPKSQVVPLNLMLEHLATIRNEDHTPYYESVHVLQCDAERFITMSRPRILAPPTRSPQQSQCQ